MREVILISSVILSGLLVFLLYKTMKNETYFRNEINRLNKQVIELNSSLLIQDGLKEKDTLNNSLLENQNNTHSSQSNIKQEYDNYVQENFNNDELSNELKDKIDNITNQEQYLQQHEEEYENQDNIDQYNEQENQYNYSVNENLNEEINDNIEANMERNNLELDSNSLENDDLQFSNSNMTNTLEENENDLQENLNSNLEQPYEGEQLDLSNIEDLESSNVEAENGDLEISNIEDENGEFELSNVDLESSNIDNENLDVNLSNNEGENGSLLEISNNEDLNFQLENMQDGLTMTDLNEGKDNNILINNLIDNALLNKDEENNNLDIENTNDNKDYSKYSLGDFEKLTLKELQDIARQNRLKIKGKKNELVDRVKAHYNFNKNLV